MTKKTLKFHFKQGAESLEALNLANGSTEHKRRKLDNYPTPAHATFALMDFLNYYRPIDLPTDIWEPACGEGAMSRVMKAYGHNVYSSDIDTAYGETGVDFLTAPFERMYGAIITNPPFSLADRFIEASMGKAPVVAMLLKSQYWHAAKRTVLFKKYPPAFVLALNWRPDFLNGERGGSPTMECIWTVWIQGNEDTRYRILPKHLERR